MMILVKEYSPLKLLHIMHIVIQYNEWENYIFVFVLSCARTRAKLRRSRMLHVRMDDSSKMIVSDNLCANNCHEQ